MGSLGSFKVLNCVAIDQDQPELKVITIICSPFHHHHNFTRIPVMFVPKSRNKQKFDSFSNFATSIISLFIFFGNESHKHKSCFAIPECLSYATNQEQNLIN